ncbi:MAG: hypothetical protein ACYS0F_06140, partial [Planctomycetota bacterium]
MRALCWILLLALPAAAGEVRGKITQVVADAVYVDIGSTQGVAAGDAGEILRVGARIADVEVVTVSGSQARLSILRSTRRPQVGDAVVLRVRAKKSDEPEEEGAKRAPDERPFEPLLERQKKRADPPSERNI